jgi:hypothetical protein
MTPEACPPKVTGSRGIWLASPLPCVRGLSGQAKILLGLMESLATKSGRAYASVDLYAGRIGLSTRQTRKLLRALERGGYIEAIGKRTGGRCLTIEYRIMPWREKAEQAFRVSDGQKAEEKGTETRNTGAGKAEQKGPKPGTGVPPSSIELQKIPEEREEGAAVALSQPARAVSDNGNGDNNGPTAVSRETTNGNGHNNEGHGHGDDIERLVRLAFPVGASEKQRRSLLSPAIKGHRAGVPYAFMANALTDPKTKELPFYQQIDRAVEVAGKVVAALNAAGPKQFRDLAHLVSYAAEDGDDLPKTVDVGLRTIPVAGILRRASTWPEGGATEDAAGPAEKKI